MITPKYQAEPKHRIPFTNLTEAQIIKKLRAAEKGPPSQSAFSTALAGTSLKVITDPDSAVPMVGASGAIGGIMGAYARLYPRARIHTLVFFGFFFTTVSLPAVAMLGYWFLIQILGGLPALAGASSGIAFWAHVGGFVAGVVLVGPFHQPAYLEAHRRQIPRQLARRRNRDLVSRP